MTAADFMSNKTKHYPNLFVAVADFQHHNVSIFDFERSFFHSFLYPLSIRKLFRFFQATVTVFRCSFLTGVFVWLFLGRLFVVKSAKFLVKHLRSAIRLPYDSAGYLSFFKKKPPLNHKPSTC